GITFMDEILVLLILSSLTSCWDGMVITISSSAFVGLKFEDFVGALLIDESRSNIQPHNDSPGNALSNRGKRKI
ncbi:hypothetical protein HAX54_006349, partial [Datura stramonium]|nr:hypothetical protein [Datura stramonium]